jgi:hypothetical protein
VISAQEAAAGRRRRLGGAIAAGLASYANGTVSRPFILRIVGPASNLSFAVGVALAIAHLPTSSTTRGIPWVSSLASARHNPSGYAYLGVVFLAVPLMLVPVPGYLAARFRAHTFMTRAGWLLLWVGIGGLFLLGVETTVFPNPGLTRFSHKLFTSIALAGLTPGFLVFGILSFRRAWTTRASLVPASLACAVLIIPAIGAGVTLATLGRTSLRVAKHGAAFFGTFVFWEWVAVVALFVGGWLTAWAASRGRPDWASRFVAAKGSASSARDGGMMTP